MPRGNQSPATPSAEMARTRTGPKAEEPKRARGSNVAHRGICIFEHQAAVAQRQHGMEAGVGRGHFNLFVAGKGLRHIGLEKEDEAAIDGQVVRAAKLHGRGRCGTRPAERLC